MKKQIQIKKYNLIFKRPAGTSRGVLKTKDTWLVRLSDEKSGQAGIGEINMFRGLSSDDVPEFEKKLIEVSMNPTHYLENLHQELTAFPSIRFGLEMALKDLNSEVPFELFNNDFTNGKTGIPINGLIWMGDIDFMKDQIRQKLELGFRCLKMKIGALNFDEEYAVLKMIREEYTAADLELRVDANGAFSPQEALEKLERLSKLQLHSIEQPIKQGQFDKMESLCAQTPLPIALDEELIGIQDTNSRKAILDQIKPQYIILKPALLGGFQSSEEWIRLAQERQIDWWITSALESNVGLNAIAQWTASLKTTAYQGLGTGQLYENNIQSPLKIEGEKLFYQSNRNWQEINFDE
jgi:o-succinylbenzoate synthase